MPHRTSSVVTFVRGPSELGDLQGLGLSLRRRGNKLLLPEPVDTLGHSVAQAALGTELRLLHPEQRHLQEVPQLLHRPTHLQHTHTHREVRLPGRRHTGAVTGRRTHVEADERQHEAQQAFPSVLQQVTVAVLHRGADQRLGLGHGSKVRGQRSQTLHTYLFIHHQHLQNMIRTDFEVR